MSKLPDPFRLSGFVALFVAGIFFARGSAVNGTEHFLIGLGGVYLMVSCAVLIFCSFVPSGCPFWVRGVAFLFLSAGLVCVALFAHLPLWYIIAVGGVVSAVAEFRCSGD